MRQIAYDQELHRLRRLLRRLEREASERVRLDQVLGRPLDLLKGTGDEVAPALGEEERLAESRFARVGSHGAVGEKLDAPEELSSQGEMAGQPIARAPIANGDAHVSTEVILGVTRDAHPVDAALDPTISSLGVMFDASRRRRGRRPAVRRGRPARPAVRRGRPA